MLIYKNTFENIKTRNYNFPIEDQFYASSNYAIVADGITRDPIGVSDFKDYSMKELLEKYPKFSGAEKAAKEICNTYSKLSGGSLKDKLIECNNSVKKLNDKYISECDYLENDYYGAVAACVQISGDILNYAYICDSGIIVYDNLGNIKFQTENDKELYSEHYINEMFKQNGISWNLPEARIRTRRDFRNNLNNIQDGKCVSYGALTGEADAAQFIRYGQLKITKEDIVLVYSDGFNNFLHDKEFINLLLNFDKEKLESYVNLKSLNDNEKYGKEKTIVYLKK